MTDIKVRIPWANVTDPTQHALLTLHDQGDGTHAPIVSNANTAGGSTPTLAEVLAAGALMGGVSTIAANDGAQASGGYLQISTDPGDGSGGDVELQAGFGVAGFRGGILITAGGDGDLGGAGSKPASISHGGGDATSGDGGDLLLRGGNGRPADGNGGDVVVTPGGGQGAGRNGLIFLNLPTSDPEVAGALWSNLGIVTVSAG